MSVSDKLEIEDKIILNTENSYLINIMYGRLLRIFSQNGRININTLTTEVNIDLGKDLIYKYIQFLYEKDKKR